MNDSERLSHGALCDLTDRLTSRRATAEPEEARALLAEFVACVSTQEAVPERLLRCFRDLFAGYLSGKYKTLDKAFLVARERRGHPGANVADEQEIALAVLRLRLDKQMSYQAARDFVCGRRHCGKGKVDAAWDRWRDDALIELRLRRAGDGNGLNQNELSLARKIIAGERMKQKRRTAKKQRAR